jgi:homopolymeric O-antigen transport system permease protein
MTANRQVARRFTLTDHMRAAGDDIFDALAGWRVWAMLALNDIKRLYRRSGIGQFWLTISMAVNIVAMGFLWGVIFKTDMRNTLPFIGVGLIVWGLLAGIVQETATGFIRSEGYLKQIRVSKTSIISQVILRNFIVFAHNIILVPFILLVYPPAQLEGLFLVPVGLIFCAVNAIWVGLLLGTLCTRFRDLPQIIQSVMQIMFFMTPILWNPAQVGSKAKYLIDFNPFATFLTILREPLLGIVPEIQNYWIAAGITVVGFATTLPFFARFRSRIVYWL